VHKATQGVNSEHLWWESIQADAMPRYFFNVRYGRESYHDEVGEELPDNVAAWHEATASAGQSIRDLDGRLAPGTDWCLEVVGEDGSTIYSIEVKARRNA
jgi:hypothetical protein